MSKRHHATKLSLWLVFTLACLAVVLAFGMIILTGMKIDVGPLSGPISTIATLLMAAIGAIGGGSAAYSAADTLRASGEGRGSYAAVAAASEAVADSIEAGEIAGPDDEEHRGSP